MADAGRAMMLYRGLYDNTHTYEKLDVVNYNGSLYISTTDGNLGTEPTDGTKWKLFLQGGVADNIQATDTHGLVGEAGESSFVQLLLDSLASRVGKDGNGNVIEDTYLQKTAVLNTLEEIDANTSSNNVAGALALKELKNSRFIDTTNVLKSEAITASGSYTATQDCYVTIYDYGTNKTGYGAITTINGTAICNTISTVESHPIVPLKKRQVFGWNGYTAGNLQVFGMC